MHLPRTVPIALLASAIIYIPLVFLRAIVPPMAWETRIGWPHAAIMRFVGIVVLAVLTLVTMACSRGIPWGDFGFRRSDGAWLKLAAGAVLLGFASTLTLKASGGAGLDAKLVDATPLQILLVVLLASCVEELFVRGWMQGFLAPLRRRVVGLRGVRVSIPVATGALAFGAMHLSLALSPIDALTLACVVAFTTLLGLLAGLARERTGSLLPAIGTHLAGNVGGILGGVASAIAAGSSHG